MDGAEAALKELREIDALMGAAITDFLNKGQAKTENAQARNKSGPRNKRFCDVLLAAGGGPGGIWVLYESIAAEMPEEAHDDLLKSLRGARERLVEQDGDAWRLLEDGLKLAQAP